MITKWGFLNNGYVSPQVSMIKEELTEDFITLFGNDVDLSPGSPNNMLINMIAERYVTFGKLFSDYYKQTNVDSAGGVYLERLAANVGLYRVNGDYASGEITFYLLDNVVPDNISYVIPKGTRVCTQHELPLYFETQKDAYINMSSTGGYTDEMYVVNKNDISVSSDAFGTYYMFDIYTKNYVYDILSLAVDETTIIKFSHVYDTVIKESNITSTTTLVFTLMNIDTVTEIKNVYVNGNIRTDYTTSVAQIPGLGTTVTLEFNADTPVVNDSVMIEYMVSSYTVDTKNKRKVTFKYRPPNNSSVYALNEDNYNMHLVYKACSATVPIKAIEMSYLYNVNDNTIVIPSGVNLSEIGCVNEYATSGGYNIEPDYILRKRVKNSYKGLGAATKAALEYRLKSLSGVTDAVIIDPYVVNEPKVTGITSTVNNIIKTDVEYKYDIKSSDIADTHYSFTTQLPDYIESVNDITSYSFISETSLSNITLSDDHWSATFTASEEIQAGDTLTLVYDKKTFTKTITLGSANISDTTVNINADVPVSSVVSLTCENHTINDITINTADSRKITYTDADAAVGNIIKLTYKQIKNITYTTTTPKNAYKVVEVTTTNNGIDTVYKSNLACNLTKVTNGSVTTTTFAFARIINGINVPITNVTSFVYNTSNLGQFKTYVIASDDYDTHNSIVNCIESYRPLGVQSIGHGDSNAHGNIMSYNSNTDSYMVTAEYPFSYYYRPVDKQFAYTMNIKWINSALTEDEHQALYESITNAVQNYLISLPFNTIIYKDKIRIIASDILLDYADEISIASWMVGTEGNMSVINEDSYTINNDERITTVDTDLTVYVSE